MPAPPARPPVEEEAMQQWRSVVVPVLLALVVAVLPSGADAASGDEQIFLQNCALCHTPERARAKHLTREGWEAIITKMIGFGCPIRGSETNQQIVLDYLTRTQGPAAAARARAWVVNQDSQDVWVIDVATRNVLAKVKVGALPHGITVSPDGTSVYVTNMGADDVTVIDTTTYATTTMGGTGRTPHEAAVSPDGRLLYVSNPSSNEVTVHDMRTHQAVATIPVGRFPHGLALSSDGRQLYVANMDGESISVIDTVTRAVAATIPTAAGPHRLVLSPDGRYVYVVNTDADRLSIIGTKEGRQIKSVLVGKKPYDVVLSHEAPLLWVANSGSDSVEAIDSRTGEPVALVPVPVTAQTAMTGLHPMGRMMAAGRTMPHGLAVTPDDRELWMADIDANTVSIIDTADRKIVATLPVGQGPHLVIITK